MTQNGDRRLSLGICQPIVRGMCYKACEARRNNSGHLKNHYIDLRPQDVAQVLRDLFAFKDGDLLVQIRGNFIGKRCFYLHNQ